MRVRPTRSDWATGADSLGAGQVPARMQVRPAPDLSVFLGAAKSILKGVGVALGLAVVAFPAASCWVEGRLSGRNECFLFWGQVLATAPGLPGKYLRKCFYFLTLRSCSLRCDLGFLSHFADRRSEVGRGVYIGSGVTVGLASLGDGCLLGNRSSLISGGWQHTLGPDGKLTAYDRSKAVRIRIGPETWIGEGAIVMASVGGRCIIGAGSVVSTPVPDGCLVAGNPARFLRRLVDDPMPRTTPSPEESSP